LQQAPNDGLFGSLQNLDDTTFRSASFIQSHDAGFDTIAVQNGSHFVGRQINIRGPIIALNKAVAVSVTRDGAFKFFQ
jgi:hypothetical protein